MRALFIAVIATTFHAAAAAQNLNVPGQLDLNGLWELTEHGAVVGGPAIVRITHSGPSVHAEFVSGAACEAGGSPRPDAFLGELTVYPTVPPTGQMSSPAMWVCSGSPAAVKQCGANSAVKPSYKTTFTGATVDPNYIQGRRVRQGYRGCNLDSSSNGVADFSLRRLAPCEFEDLTVARLEQELADILDNTVIPAGPYIEAAADAAHARFGATYGGRPTDTLRHPYPYVTTLIGNPLAGEALAAALPEIIADPEWIAARQMAAEMGAATPPLIEGLRMLDRLTAIEQSARRARRVFEALYDARAAQRKCRQGKPQ